MSSRATGLEFASKTNLDRLERANRYIIEHSLSDQGGLVRSARRILLNVKLEQMRRRNGGFRWDQHQGPIH